MIWDGGTQIVLFGRLNQVFDIHLLQQFKICLCTVLLHNVAGIQIVVCIHVVAVEVQL